MMRRAAVTAAATAALLGGALAPSAAAEGHTPVAPKAGKAGWSCKTSSKTIDNPGDSSPYADDYRFKATVCATRVGGRVASYTKLWWDTPDLAADRENPYDSAYAKEYMKKSVQGKPDPVVCNRDTDYIHDVIGKYQSSGTITSRGLGCDIGKYAVGDFALVLDWDNDGKGQQTYRFSASPRV